MERIGDQGALSAGENVLITGIGGGVAAAALQLAVALGANVYVTSSSGRRWKAPAMGAAGGFNYQDADWRKAVGKAAGGIDVVFDGAPARVVSGVFPRFQPRRPRGDLRFDSRSAVPVNVPELFLKNIDILGTNVGTLQELGVRCRLPAQASGPAGHRPYFGFR